MIFFQRDQDVGIFRADDAADVVSSVDAAVRQPDVVENAAEFGRGNGAADRLSTRSQSRAVSSMRVPVFARTCRLNCPLSRVGKEILAQPRNSMKPRTQRPRNTGTNTISPVDKGGQQQLIAEAHALEGAFEPRWKSVEGIARSPAARALRFSRYIASVGTRVRERK